MAIKITRTDPRYAMLGRSRNLRWDGDEAEGADIRLRRLARAFDLAP